MEIGLEYMLSGRHTSNRGMDLMPLMAYNMIGDMYVTDGRVIIDHGNLGGGIAAHDTYRLDRFNNPMGQHTTIDAGYGKCRIPQPLEPRLDDRCVSIPKKFEHY